MMLVMLMTGFAYVFLSKYFLFGSRWRLFSVIGSGNVGNGNFSAIIDEATKLLVTIGGKIAAKLSDIDCNTKS